MVIAMLALGIAGAAGVFSMFDCLFLRPLPFAESERLVDVDETAPRWNLTHVGVSNPDICQWKSVNATFEGMDFFRTTIYNLYYQLKTQRVLG